LIVAIKIGENDAIHSFVLFSIGGKTTCISLLEHFYDADDGQVLIDNIPVKNYDYKFYHEKVHFFLNRFLFY